MDREVVEQKLESLRRCLQRIETKIINWHIVYSIVKNHMADFSAFAKIVSRKLDKQ